ncbi:hypothetical protein HMPREF1142_0692 [Peptostreptococcaceae bacterium AS15]|nr:hypothetical protein HMPREF1142_0692 [Peptostreptococcaceae bacterium AS15]
MKKVTQYGIVCDKNSMLAIIDSSALIDISFFVYDFLLSRAPAYMTIAKIAAVKAPIAITLSI